MTGLNDRQQCTVGHDACSQCVKWYPPSPEYLNPVVASLLYTLSSTVIQSDGLPGCSRSKATELQQLAAAGLPNDYDAVPVADQVDLQPNRNIGDIGQLIPRPRFRYGARVSEWAVSVTTAPRQSPTLDRCLSSIVAAGWPQPRIIVDGNVEIPDAWNSFPITRREPQMGAWPSYFLTLTEMMMRQPRADAYMIVQDDVVLFEHESLRSYLESVLWHHCTPGIVSLFCSKAYAREKPGWYRLDRNLVWGGQALVFSREAAIRFVADPLTVRHRFSEGDRGLANIDWLVGEWAGDTDTPVHVSTPSLSQHIGHVSSLWPNSKAFANRSAESFAGNYPLNQRDRDATGRRSS